MKLTSRILSVGLVLASAAAAGAAPGQFAGGRAARASAISGGFASRATSTTTSGTTTGTTGTTTSTTGATGCSGSGTGTTGTTGTSTGGTSTTGTIIPQASLYNQSTQSGGSAQVTVTPTSSSATLAALFQAVQSVSGVVSLNVQATSSQSVTLAVGGNGQVSPATLAQAIQRAGFQITAMSVQYAQSNGTALQSSALSSQAQRTMATQSAGLYQSTSAGQPAAVRSALAAQSRYRR